jgi:all-trans-retinol 13,14-reductase
MSKHKQWDAIVIGSGMGGMSCAAALAKYGRRVLVLEQHYVAGGFTHTFTRKGYHWDVGVHCLGEMEPSRPVGRMVSWLSNDRVHMERLGDVYETFVFPDGFRFELPASREKYRENLEAAFPEEKEAIAKYIQMVREAAKAAKPHFMMRILPEWVERVAAPVMYRRGREWWDRTTADVLNELTDNKRLKGLLAGQWGYYGSPPSRSSFAIHAVTVRHFWNGGYYPAGGSAIIAESLLENVKLAGGEVWLRASVEEVIVEGGRAVGVRVKRAQEGVQEVRAPIVISAAGARATVDRLIPAQLRQEPWAQEIHALKQSPAHVCLNLGFEGDIVAAGATRANQWYFETYDMEDETWHVEDPKALAPALYVSFPSLKDPTYDPGPQKRHTGEVVTFAPWVDFEKWKDTRRGNRQPDYSAFKKEIEDRLLAHITRYLPELMKLVKHHEISTPLSTTHFTRAPEGAIYGLEPTPERFRCRGLRTRTPVKGLYLAGADVATLGVVGAMVGGILAAGTIEPRVLSRLR